ncbi:F-box protein DOR [Raphanus sativus]|nr:F-box protein DOR [Raphanus sativus]
MEECQAVVGRLNAGVDSLHIPDELIFEILLRLPAKSIARYRCLSKLWASVLDGQDFTDRYLTISSARPQLLFAVEKDGELSFFTSPHHQPQNQEEDDNTSHAAVNYHMTPDSPIIKSRIKTMYGFSVRYLFGYDPVDKQFKVLSIGWARAGYDAIYQEHQVVTLETGKLSWRMIECGVPHFPCSSPVCINGVLYYKAALHGSTTFNDTIMSFDVRSEKYSFIKVMEPFTELMHPATTLINCNGKLASIRATECFCFSRKSTSFEMWVLDDLEKKEWSKHVYKLPPIWESIAADNALYCAGVTCSNEVVLVTYSQYNPFYVFYYSLQTDTSRIVEIHGMGAFSAPRVYTFVDHVEDVKLLKGVLGL